MATTGIHSHSVGPYSVRLWESGSGGTPLVYLHGYERHPGGASFLQRLAGGRHVIAPEQPGYGESTGFEQFHRPIDVVLFYRQLLESLDLGEVDLVGHSMGGMFAAEFAAICPQHVRRLVLVDAFGLWIDDEPSVDPYGSAEDQARAKWASGSAPQAEPTIYVEDPNDPHGGIIFAAQCLGASTKFLWPIADHELWKRLPLVKAPTLVVQGGADGLVPPSYGRRFADLVPDAAYAEIAGAGHYPMVEQEDAFVAAVESFLQG